MDINILDIMDEINSTSTASVAAVDRAAELRWGKEGNRYEVDMGTVIMPVH